MVMVANKKSENNTSKGRYLSEKTPENTPNDKKGYQPNDNEIKNVHTSFLPKTIFISQVDSALPIHFSRNLIEDPDYGKYII